MTQIVLENRRGIIMTQSTDPVQNLIVELRSAFETETTIGRILGRSKQSLERFLANPASLDRIKESLARVLSRKAIPYGQPVDQDGYGSWRLYTDPDHLFCIRPTHQRSTTSRQPHDHGELGWAVYGILVRRDGPANLPARGRWQRAGPSTVACRCRRSVRAPEKSLSFPSARRMR